MSNFIKHNKLYNGNWEKKKKKTSNTFNKWNTTFWHSLGAQNTYVQLPATFPCCHYYLFEPSQAQAPALSSSFPRHLKNSARKQKSNFDGNLFSKQKQIYRWGKLEDRKVTDLLRIFPKSNLPDVKQTRSSNKWNMHQTLSAETEECSNTVPNLSQ